VKFGFFSLGHVPKPLDRQTWADGQEQARVNEWLEQAEAYERLGYDYIWVGEHHFMGEYTHMSAPDLYMAAVSQRTKRIRLGSAITQLSTHHNHPARVAERMAWLDLLSNGRWEFGSGPAGIQEIRPVVYAVDGEVERVTKEAGEIWESNLRECVRMMTEDPYPGYDGKYLKMPPATVVPRVVQSPHPPLWRSVVRPGSYGKAARLGVGALMLAAFGVEQIRAGVTEYWDGIRAGIEPVGKVSNPATAVFIHMHCARTDADAQARGRTGIDFFSWGISHSAQRVGRSGVHLNRELHAALDAGTFDSSVFFNFGPTALIGSPATLREMLRQVEQTNVDLVIFTHQVGETPHEALMESMELVAEQVLPEFRDREDAHTKWRAEQTADIPVPVSSTV
jgi:alkanesulfonate monooxygenase SsuD/methylene tetrahydromethanopterin reductase-like flavin-dependent oxidoreductase (luciferase family)